MAQALAPKPRFAGFDAYIPLLLRSFVLYPNIEVVEAGDVMVDSPAPCTERKERGTLFQVRLRPDVYTLAETPRGACAGHGRFPYLARKRPRSFVISRPERLE
jgi:hypothetical protein